jgi:5-methylthioadenosine/S-adenosylhomocysteine deaminase
MVHPSPFASLPFSVFALTISLDKIPMLDLLITHVNPLLATAPGGYAIHPAQAIHIAGGRITAITAMGEALPPARDIIDGKGLIALPGLINTHAHVPMVLFRGIAEDVEVHRWFNEFIWPVESNLTDEDVYWGMLLGLAEMIESGVTTVADHYFAMDHAAQAVEEAGTRALLGWAVFASQGYDALDRTAAFVRRRHGSAGGRITACMAPHAPYTCDDDFLRATVRHARTLGVPIHLHAAEELFQTTSSLQQRGITPIQVLEETGILAGGRTIIAHGCGILPEDIQLLSRYAGQVGVTHTPKTYLKMAAGMTPLRELRAAGVEVGLCTDGAASNNTLDILENMRLMAMVQKSRANDAEIMPLAEVLGVTFRGSAAVLGMEQEIGALSPGYAADILLADFSGLHLQPLHNPLAALVYSLRASDIVTTIVAGKVLMRDRQLLTLNKRRIVAEVQATMERLSQRTPGRTIQVYQP